MKNKKPAGPRAIGEFKLPGQSLSGLDPQAISTLLCTAADMTLVLDGNGTIRDIAYGDPTLAAELGDHWLEQRWVDTVSEDSRGKIQALLAAPVSGAMRWRQVNQSLPDGSTMAMSFASMAVPGQAGKPVRWYAFGRDQRVTNALQQRLVEAQLSVERDYARFRQAELRYRQLFQMAGEAVLVVDATTGRVLEANPAAASMMGTPAEKMVGQIFPLGLTPRSTKQVASLLATARRSGRADPVSAELADSHAAVQVSATLLHQDQSHLLLVRLSRLDSLNGQTHGAESAMLLQLAQGAPDGLVVTDLDGLVQAANTEFVNLCQMASDEQMRGQSLERWLGRTEVDLGVLVSNLRQRGAVKLFATTLRGEFGASTEVEISAVTVTRSDPMLLGFTVRDVGRRLQPEAAAAQALPRSVNQLTELVGRVPMKDIVGETTDLIEKRCIEAALELTRDNRASAAEILGLSRQSLYVKLRRYGLGDLGPGVEK
ncbi:MAG: transcriptional regulator PpsR [Pseudomonadota bacterium]